MDLTPTYYQSKTNRTPWKNTSPFAYKVPFQNILNNLPNTTIYYTDGSKTQKRAGFALSIKGKIFLKRHRNSLSVFTTELQAIYLCLEPILSNLQLLDQPAPIVSDPLAAVTTISDTGSSHPLVSRILVQLSSFSISFIWIPSYMSILGNEGVDKAAKATSFLHYVSPQLLPTKTDLTRFKRQLITTHWYEHWRNQSPKNTLDLIKPSPLSLRNHDYPPTSKSATLVLRPHLHSPLLPILRALHPKSSPFLLTTSSPELPLPLTAPIIKYPSLTPKPYPRTFHHSQTPFPIFNQPISSAEFKIFLPSIK